MSVFSGRHHSLLLLISLLILIVALTHSFSQSPAIKHKIYNGIILAIITLLYWTFYQLSPLTLMLFIERNVDKHLLSFIISPQWLQIVNGLAIIIGGPVFYFLFKWSRKSYTLINVYSQFSAALLLLGISFLIICTGIYFSDKQGFTHIYWIISSFITQGISELLIAPIGFAFIAKLVTSKFHGMLMGLWMMLIGAGAILAGYLSKIILIIPSSNPQISNAHFYKAFLIIGLTIIIFSCFTCLLPRIHFFRK